MGAQERGARVDARPPPPSGKSLPPNFFSIWWHFSYFLGGSLRLRKFLREPIVRTLMKRGLHHGLTYTHTACIHPVTLSLCILQAVLCYTAVTLCKHLHNTLYSILDTAPI